MYNLAYFRDHRHILLFNFTSFVVSILCHEARLLVFPFLSWSTMFFFRIERVISVRLYRAALRNYSQRSVRFRNYDEIFVT